MHILSLGEESIFPCQYKTNKTKPIVKIEHSIYYNNFFINCRACCLTSSIIIADSLFAIIIVTCITDVTNVKIVWARDNAA